MTKYKYQTEYETSPCFWGINPAKYVRLLVNHLGGSLTGMQILDLGAGEGKNAVYLANEGGKILAIDTSALALSRFPLQPNYEAAKSRIKTIVADIRDLHFEESTFNIVVAYGILHCLNSRSEIIHQISKIKKWIKADGYFVCCLFTDEIPPPECQPYLTKESFIKKGELQKLMQEWETIAYEDDILEEMHPTSNSLHHHSVSRIIARKRWLC